MSDDAARCMACNFSGAGSHADHIVALCPSVALFESFAPLTLCDDASLVQ
jgi:hypothetical protein